MTDDYVFTGDTAAASGRLEKFLKIFIVVALIFLGGEIVWLLGISPFRPFSKIDVTGFDGIDKTEIFSAAGLDDSSSYFSTDAKAVEDALAGISFIESAKVIKHYPDRLQIVLSGRRAVAQAFAGLSGRTVPVLIDGKGVIFNINEIEAEKFLPEQLPVVSGIIIENPVPGTRLPAALLPLFGQLEKIHLSSPELLQAVSEIKVNRGALNGFDFFLYPAHKRIKVRLSELNGDILRYTLLMLDVLASSEDEIDTLDFRSGIASYIPKEATPE